MRQGTIIVTPPTVQPVSLADAKQQLRIDPGDTVQDAFITRLCAAAHQAVETMLGYPVMRQTRQTQLQGFPCGPIWLGGGHLPAILQLQYLDSAGALQTMPADDYVLDEVSRPAAVWPAPDTTWPATQSRPGAVKIEWQAGWTSADAVPADLIHAMMLLIGHWDQNREAVVTGTIATTLQFSVDALLEHHRLVFVP